MCESIQRLMDDVSNAKQMEIAKNLLMLKTVAHEQIAQAVGLPPEKIEQLAAELGV